MGRSDGPVDPVYAPIAYLNAGNFGPFTLDGTRTFRVGARDAVLLDPGPDVESHVRALRAWVEDADRVRLLLTHGHADHAGSAGRLAELLGAAVMGPRGVAEVDTPLADGAEIVTDEGTLRAVDMPGHARPHFCYHWVEANALFVGDLILGEGDTTWVGEYAGCVEDYLNSLTRVRALAPAKLYPAHGPPVEDVPATLHRYESHRRERIREVADALRAMPDATPDDLLRMVYGRNLPSAIAGAARMSLGALLDHVRRSHSGA